MQPLSLIAIKTNFERRCFLINILIIDGQGGGIGGQLVAAIKDAFPDYIITAVGTNTVATSVMLKAGASHAATGENSVIVGCRKADVIIGPLGIAIADALVGEVTPAMALAVAQSGAKRIFIPANHCDNIVAGIYDLSLNKLVQNVIAILKTI